MRRMLMVMCSVALLASCVATQMSGSLDSKVFRGPYQRLCVEWRGQPNFHETAQLEARLARRLTRGQSTAVTASSLFMPTKHYTDAQKRQILRQQGIDAIVRLQVKDLRAEAHTREITKTETYDGIVAGKKVRLDHTVPVTEHYETYNVTHDVTVVDVAQNKTVWFGSANADVYDRDDAAGSVTGKLVTELANAGVIPASLSASKRVKN